MSDVSPSPAREAHRRQFFVPGLIEQVRRVQRLSFDGEQYLFVRESLFEGIVAALEEQEKLLPSSAGAPSGEVTADELRDAMTAWLGGEEWRRVADSYVDRHLQGHTNFQIAGL